MQAKITEYTNMTQKIEREDFFQETEIGLIPQDWDVIRLGDVCEKVKAGGTPSRRQESYWNGDIPFLLIEDMTATEKYLHNTKSSITKKGLENSSSWIVPPNSLILSLYGTVGKAVINKIPVSITQNMGGIIPNKEKVDTDFLYYSLENSKKYLWSVIDISVHKHITTTKAKQIPIPLPPLPEQRKIAKVLGTVQKAIEQQDIIIEVARNLKKSLMQKLFVEGLGHTEFKETEIGEIPQEWKVVRLGDVVESKRKSINPLNHLDEVFEYYSIPAYHANQEPVMEVGKNIRSQKFLIKDSTVLFGKLNPRVPKVWLVESNTKKRKIASTELIPLCPREDGVNSLFLFYLCWSDHVLPKSRELVSGTTPSRQRVDINAFFKIQIPLPPSSEQQEIARILRTVDNKIEVEKKRKATLNELFKTMLRNLMTGEIRLKDVEV